MVKDTTVHSARLGTTFNNLDGSKYTLTENDCKQEDITEKIRRIVGSYPIYKNPVQPYVYEPKIRKYFDSNVWGWDGSTDVVGYYNKGNGKGRIDVTINEIKGMTEEEFEEMFPDAAKNVRKTIIEQYDARKKIDNLFVSKDNK